LPAPAEARDERRAGGLEFMLSMVLDRRAVLVGLAAAVGSTAEARAQTGPQRFSSVAVDVRPLHARGLGPYAELVRSALQAELQAAYGERLGGGRNAPRLVVRLDGISLRPYAGRSGGRSFGGGTDTDYLEGEALVVSPAGQILLRHPQLSALPSNSGGAWYDPASEQRRVTALAAHYAGWLRRSPI
jgi:hypothetical protein